jgi:hypothetical protein
MASSIISSILKRLINFSTNPSLAVGGLTRNHRLKKRNFSALETRIAYENNISHQELNIVVDGAQILFALQILGS